VVAQGNAIRERCSGHLDFINILSMIKNRDAWWHTPRCREPERTKLAPTEHGSKKIPPLANAYNWHWAETSAEPDGSSPIEQGLLLPPFPAFFFLAKLTRPRVPLSRYAIVPLDDEHWHPREKSFFVPRLDGSFTSPTGTTRETAPTTEAGGGRDPATWPEMPFAETPLLRLFLSVPRAPLSKTKNKATRRKERVGGKTNQPAMQSSNSPST